MKCPNCAAEMSTMTLDARMGGPVNIDLCAPCQAFWFDKYESLQLSPASTLKLMKLIGEQSSAGKAVHEGNLRCPRCSIHLAFTYDLQRSTRFSYWRCEKHGRFIGFIDFLREKNFIRPLSPQQLTELRRNIQIVNCSNCGAAIDLVKDSACAHCGSAISMLDMKQPQELLAQLQHAAETKADGEPLVELMRGAHGFESALDPGESPLDLVQANLSALARWLTKAGL